MHFISYAVVDSSLKVVIFLKNEKWFACFCQIKLSFDIAKAEIHHIIRWHVVCCYSTEVRYEPALIILVGPPNTNNVTPTSPFSKPHAIGNGVWACKKWRFLILTANHTVRIHRTASDKNILRLDLDDCNHKFSIFFYMKMSFHISQYRKKRDCCCDTNKNECSVCRFYFLMLVTWTLFYPRICSKHCWIRLWVAGQTNRNSWSSVSCSSPLKKEPGIKPPPLQLMVVMLWHGQPASLMLQYSHLTDGVILYVAVCSYEARYEVYHQSLDKHLWDTQ